VPYSLVISTRRKKHIFKVVEVLHHADAPIKDMQKCQRTKPYAWQPS
jgi:hypothetical protein